MKNPHDMESGAPSETFASRALLLLFGIGVLGFLVAIDHPQWFSIRPATGTSIAMSRASHAANDGVHSNAATAVNSLR